MSNAYRKTEQPKTEQPKTPLPPIDEQVVLVSAAIQKLYEARGGLDIEAQIDVARLDIENARACRMAEAARLKEDPNAQREKGERPLVSVSEDRLHSRELSRLHELRETKRGLCRTQIQEALHRVQPRTLEELRKTLDDACKDIDDVARMLPSQRDRLDPVIAACRSFAKQPESVLPADQRAALLDAAERRDEQAIVAVLKGLSSQAHNAFDEELRVAYGAA